MPLASSQVALVTFELSFMYGKRSYFCAKLSKYFNLSVNFMQAVHSTYRLDLWGIGVEAVPLRVWFEAEGIRMRWNITRALSIAVVEL